MTAFQTHRCGETVLVNTQGFTQHSSNPDTYFPPVACLFITYYSFPPLNILASLIIILKEISCQLFLFSCLFQDHVPSQWENKKKKTATGTWWKHTWAAPAWHGDGLQALRAVIPTVLPENKCGDKLLCWTGSQNSHLWTYTHQPNCWGLFDILNSSEHE